MDQRLLTGIEKSPRIQKLIDHLYATKPQIEPDRAELMTESFKQTEAEPMVIRKAKAFQNILRDIPICSTIQENFREEVYSIVPCAWRSLPTMRTDLSIPLQSATV